MDTDRFYTVKRLGTPRARRGQGTIDEDREADNLHERIIIVVRFKEKLTWNLIQ
jgi:hypothetical protein